MIIRRFIERDYMYNIVKSNTEFLTEEQIENELNNHQWSDITFKFIPKVSGWHTLIIDNDTDERLTFDELNSVAKSYYLQQVEELSVKRARDKIREVLYA